MFTEWWNWSVVGRVIKGFTIIVNIHCLVWEFGLFKVIIQIFIIALNGLIFFFFSTFHRYNIISHQLSLDFIISLLGFAKFNKYQFKFSNFRGANRPLTNCSWCIYTHIYTYNVRTLRIEELTVIHDHETMTTIFI